MFIKNFRPNFVNRISKKQNISNAQWARRNSNIKFRGCMGHRSVWLLEQKKMLKLK